MVVWKEAFRFVRNLFFNILEKKVVWFFSFWGLEASDITLQFQNLFSWSSEEDFDFSGGERPLMICRKQDQSHCLLFFPPSKFSRFQHDHLLIQKGWNLQLLSCATHWIQFIVLWNWFPSSNSRNSEIILVGFNQKECRTFSNMYIIFKMPLRRHLAAWGCPALPRCCSVCCKASVRNTQVCSLQSKY